MASFFICEIQDFMAVRTIILLRHGQYTPFDKKKKTTEVLTALGRKQAQLAGKRLQEYKIEKIVSSTMPRALETSKIINTYLKCKSVKEDRNLCECVPGFPRKLRKKYKYTDIKKLQTSTQQLEKVFQKYFKSSKLDTTDLIVCHGNVIRFLVLKTLGLDTIVWRSLDIQQCGITIVKIRSKGDNKKVLISHNDIGHIPLKMRTFI